MNKKTTIPLITAFMIVSTAFAGLFVAPGIFIRDVTAAGGSFGGGDGSAGNPYIIEDVDDLQAMSGDLNAHYVLGNDIDAKISCKWNFGEGF